MNGYIERAEMSRDRGLDMTVFRLLHPPRTCLLPYRLDFHLFVPMEWSPARTWPCKSQGTPWPWTFAGSKCRDARCKQAYDLSRRLMSRAHNSLFSSILLLTLMETVIIVFSYRVPMYLFHELGTNLVLVAYQSSNFWKMHFQLVKNYVKLFL